MIPLLLAHSRRRPMLYQNSQAFSGLARPARAVADKAAAAFAQPVPGLSYNALLSAAAALRELVAIAGLSHCRHAFGIDTIEIDGRRTAMREMAIHRTPFD